jgi:hypothetical protein
VLLDRNYFTRRSAIKWIEDHGFEFNKIHTTKNYYRFRQFPPRKDRYYRIIKPKYKKGIKFVVEFRE